MSYIVEIDDLVGKPWRWMARGPEAYDCLGICEKIAERAGIPYPSHERPAAYDQDAEALIQQGFEDAERTGWSRLHNVGIPKALTSIKFKIHKRFHIGITVDNYGHFIHCVTGHHVAVTSITCHIWERYIEGYYVYSRR